MSYAVVLRRGAADILTFNTPTPLPSPRTTYEKDDDDPPRLASISKTWEVEILLLGSESSVETQLNAIKAVIEDPTNYPDGARLIRDAGGADSILERIDAEGGYDEFFVDAMVLPISDGYPSSEIKVQLTISGKRKFPDANGITKFTQSESYAYDDCGLLTRTLVTEVETDASESAEAKARLFFLTLPGASFGYLTKGPEGANIDVLNKGDTKARSISIIQENGVALPADVSPIFSKSITTQTQEGETFTITTISTRGTGAEAAVRAAEPGTKLQSSVITVNDAQCTATGVFVQRDTTQAASKVIRFHSFDSRGGGKPLVSTPRSGNRVASVHVLARTLVELIETITLEVTQSTTPIFKFPPPLSGVIEDTDALAISHPRIVSFGSKKSGDRWQAGTRRTYRPQMIGSALVSRIEAAVAAQKMTTTLEQEVGRKNVGLGGAAAASPQVNRTP